MTGTVKYFDPTKGYGHVIADDKGPDIFVHYTVLESGVRLYTGQKVEVSLVPNYPTRRALNLRIIDNRAYVPISEGRKAVVNGD